MQNPNDTVLYAAYDARAGLALFGISKRKMALVKAQAVLRVNGFESYGWKLSHTITLRGGTRVVNHMKECFKARTDQELPWFYDNRQRLEADVMHPIVLRYASVDDVRRVMQLLRNDLTAFLARSHAHA